MLEGVAGAGAGELSLFGLSTGAGEPSEATGFLGLGFVELLRLSVL